MATEQQETPVKNGQGEKTALDAEAERKRLARLDKLNAPPDGEHIPIGTTKKDEPKPPDPMRVLAHRAVEIAEAGGAKLGSAITAPQAQLIAERLGSEPGKAFEPATLQQLQHYAQGGKGAGRDEIPGEALAKIRAFCKATESRRIWPRKVAAMVLALHEQQTGHVRPNTKAKT
jgi:hypothetical protein